MRAATQCATFVSCLRQCRRQEEKQATKPLESNRTANSLRNDHSGFIGSSKLFKPTAEIN